MAASSVHSLTELSDKKINKRFTWCNTNFDRECSNSMHRHRIAPQLHRIALFQSYVLHTYICFINNNID